MTGSEVARVIALTAKETMEENKEIKGTLYVQGSQVKALLRALDSSEIDTQAMFRSEVDGVRLKEISSELLAREIHTPIELLKWSNDVADVFTKAFVVTGEDETRIRGTVSKTTTRVYKVVFNGYITRNVSRILNLTA